MLDHRFIYEIEGLESRAILVYIFLEEHANKEGKCWPGQKFMAKSLKLSVKTVRRALEDLKKHELITTKRRYRYNGSYSTLEYRLTRVADKTNGG